MKKLPFLLGLCALLTGCIRPYEVPVEQGIQITPKQMAQLKPGMTQDQVSYLLGTPNIQDPFYPNRWYYLYTNQHDHLPRTERYLVVFFKDGKVDQIKGDYAPPSKLEYQQK